MPFEILRHHVEDFDGWKATFDAQATARAAAGCTGHRIFRDASDPNEVTVLLQWQSLSEARAFSEDPELAAAMASAGVQEPALLAFVDAAS